MDSNVTKVLTFDKPGQMGDTVSGRMLELYATLKGQVNKPMQYL